MLSQLEEQLLLKDGLIIHQVFSFVSFIFILENGAEAGACSPVRGKGSGVGAAHCTSLLW